MQPLLETIRNRVAEAMPTPIELVNKIKDRHVGDRCWDVKQAEYKALYRYFARPLGRPSSAQLCADISFHCYYISVYMRKGDILEFTLPERDTERRFGNDGGLYTEFDFIRHYSHSRGQWNWLIARCCPGPW